MSVKCPKCQTDNPDTQSFCGDCGTNLSLSEEISAPTKTIETPSEELKRGSVFAGRYEIIEELGKGGMGKVYRVEDKKVKEEIALKLIKPEIAADKKTIERFRNELKIARRIRHKNVCAMFDLSEEKGSHFITMEYVSGGDLKKFIRRSGQMGIGKAISIAKQICEGLEEAHSLGIVHRDLKPNNIMIDDNGNARIMDFGIARTLKEKGITGSGVMIGTPEYMSPEQVEAKEVDQRSDIYSLGIILYEMLTGRLPFEADTPFAVGIKQKSETPKSPKEYNSQISDDLNRVILKCLEKDTENRYEDAGEVKSELEKLEQGLPTTDRVIPKKKTLTSQEITVQFSLKKIFIPAIAVIVIALIGLIIWSPWTQKGSAPILSEKPSIAVLPFEDESPLKDQGALCNGIPEQIILALSQIENLDIPAPTSSFSLREKELNEIGEKLKVKTVLKGNLRKAGNRIRITPQLVNIDDGSLIWGDTYESDQDDIFDIQDEITLKIIEILKVKLLGEERQNVVKRYTNNSDAYNLYLKGLYFWNLRTEEGLKSAIDFFNQAIELDQDFALAYTGIANSYNLLSLYGSLPAPDSFPKARDAALKALKIDETMAEVHTALGYVKMRHDWDWKGAEDSYLRAIELNTNYSTSHFWYAELLALEGRFDEAVEEINRAIELDPVSMIINSGKGLILLWARRHDQGIEYIQKALSMNPDYPFAHVVLGLNYLYSNNFSRAIAELERANDLYENSIYSLGQLGHGYARVGEIDKANEILEKLLSLSKNTYVAPWWIAIIYEGLGDKDKALEWLEKAFQERYEMLAFLNVGPYVDGLRSDPRFEQLLKKIGFED